MLPNSRAPPSEHDRFASEEVEHHTLPASRRSEFEALRNSGDWNDGKWHNGRASMIARLLYALKHSRSRPAGATPKHPRPVGHGERANGHIKTLFVSVSI